MEQESPSSSLSHAHDAALEAVLRGDPIDFQRFRAVLDAGADPNWHDHRDTPLIHKLAMKNAVEAIRYAVEKGADIHDVDNYGNNVLAATFMEDTQLALLKLGASPSHKNDAFRTASQELPMYAGRHQFNRHIEHSSNLLKHCIPIEEAAQKHTLSENTWNSLWPKGAFDYGGYTGPLPRYTTLIYFLHKMEETGQFMPKLAYEGEASPEIALRHAISTLETAAVAWRDHCDKAGTPMTPKDWQAADIASLCKDGKVACLFTADYWQDKPSLDAMFALFDALPDEAKSPLHPRMEHTLGTTISVWLRHGAGKALDSDALREFRKEMPENAKPLLQNFHRLLVERQQKEQSPSRGR